MSKVVQSKHVQLSSDVTLLLHTHYTHLTQTAPSHTGCAGDDLLQVAAASHLNSPHPHTQTRERRHSAAKRPATHHKICLLSAVEGAGEVTLVVCVCVCVCVAHCDPLSHRLADELVEEVVGVVSSELEGTCDTIATNMFCREFKQTPSYCVIKTV